MTIAATKTFGWVEYGADPDRRVALYRVHAVPYVATHLKRVFVRADATTPGVIYLNDTPEIARDLEWFMLRYPLEADPDTLAHLTAQADQHRTVEEQVQLVLEGYRPQDPDWLQPEMTPRGYQEQADALVATTGFLLNGDDLGLGKTFTSALRFRDPAALPAAVVCPVHLCRQWKREINRAFPWLLVHIVDSGRVYDLTRKRECRGNTPDVLIFTYGKLPGWADHLAGSAKTVIFDEIHELHTGEGTIKWSAAATVAWKAVYRIGCSATPVANYGGEIWHLMQVLAPGVLGSKDEFKREWCTANAGMGSHMVVKSPRELGGYLRDTGMMLARTRQELHRELPEPILVEQPTDTDHAHIADVAAACAEQARILAGEVDADFMARGRAAREIDWKLRQATGVAKAAFVAEFIKLLLASEERVVVWAWHRRVYEILLAALADYKPALYTGTESPTMKERSAKAFCGGHSRVLMMSLRSGAGLDGLQKWCSVGVFAEMDWSPETHAQCMGRLARDGQPKTVVGYYMTSDDGTDPLMTELLGIKKQQGVPIRRPDADLFATLTDPTARGRQLAADVLRRINQPIVSGST